MTLSFIDRGKIQGDHWDRLVRGSPDGWVFALYGWQELILSVEEWRLADFSFGVLDNGDLVAVVPLQFNPGTEMLGLSAWGGCGPVLRGDISSAERARLLAEIYKRCRTVGAECGAGAIEFQQMAVTRSSLGSSRGVNPAVFDGFDDLSGLTQVIDLSSGDDGLWANLAKNARNIIRRAEKSGIRAERVDWRDHLHRYYELHCETYNRTGVTPHPIAYFAGIAEKMAPADHAALIAAYDAGGRVIAYHNDAWFGAGALYHTGCSLDDAQDTGANYLLLWKAIVAAKAAGKCHYEVGPIFPTSSDRKQQGLTFFKTRFGGEPHRAFRSSMKLKFDIDTASANPADCVSGARFSRASVSRLARRLLAWPHQNSRSGPT